MIGGMALMNPISLTPERQAQLEAFAQQRGQDPAAALDDALAAYLEQEQQEFADAVAGIERGYADVQASRTRPAHAFMSELRQKHGFSR